MLHDVIVESVRVRYKPVFQCAQCLCTGVGATRELVTNTWNPTAMEDNMCAGPHYKPAGWASFGEKQYKCAQCLKTAA